MSDFIEGLVLRGAVLIVVFSGGVLVGVWYTVRSLRLSTRSQDDDDTGPGLHGPLKGYYK